MILSFELTMPNRGSWNGQWSGQGNKYFVIKKVAKRFVTKQEHFKTLLEKGRDGFYYRWDDGWGANVEVEIVNAAEANKRRKISSGFAGYNWMIDSILHHGEIKTRTVTL